MALILKLLVTGTGIFIWFFTQRKLGTRKIQDTQKITDFPLEWTSSLHSCLVKKPQLARGVLISSSMVIDGLGLFLIVTGLIGPSVRPLIGLLILFGLRQVNQALVVLPTPKGIIWNHPGFPSIFVTYGVSNDLFFSGHTALAVFGALELAQWSGLSLWVASFVIVYEVLAVIALRAHWTMDIFTGAITAMWTFEIVQKISPVVDQWFANF